MVMVIRFYIGSDNAHQARQKHFIYIICTYLSAAAIETAAHYHAWALKTRDISNNICS